MAEINENRLQDMQANLMCPICLDYFKQAITLNCTHSFCYDCIDSWRKTRNECPVCHMKVESLTASLALDNLVSAYTNKEKVVTRIITEEQTGATKIPNPDINEELDVRDEFDDTDMDETESIHDEENEDMWSDVETSETDEPFSGDYNCSIGESFVEEEQYQSSSCSSSNYSSYSSASEYCEEDEDGDVSASSNYS